MSIAMRAAALVVAGLLAGCSGGMAIGPEPDDLETEMTAPNPMATGEIDDATGSMIP